MKFESIGSSVGSKILPRKYGPMPAFERTEGEKIRLARMYLEKRSFVVMPDLLTKSMVSAYLGCSQQHVTNLLKEDDFPKPFDINAFKSSIDHSRTTPRWSAPEITAWLESRRVYKLCGFSDSLQANESGLE